VKTIPDPNPALPVRRRITGKTQSGRTPALRQLLAHLPRLPQFDPIILLDGKGVQIDGFSNLPRVTFFGPRAIEATADPRPDRRQLLLFLRCRLAPQSGRIESLSPDEATSLAQIPSPPVRWATQRLQQFPELSRLDLNSHLAASAEVYFQI